MSVEQFLNGMELDRFQHSLFIKMLDALSKYEGKDVSKRIESYLKEHFPEYRIYGYWEYGNFEIIVNHKELSEKFQIERILEFRLATESNKTYSRERIYRELNPQYGIGAQERLEKFEKLSLENIETFKNKIDLYNSKVKELQSLENEINKESREMFGSTYYPPIAARKR